MTDRFDHLVALLRSGAMYRLSATVDTYPTGALRYEVHADSTVVRARSGIGPSLDEAAGEVIAEFAQEAARLDESAGRTARMLDAVRAMLPPGDSPLVVQ